MCIIQRDPLSHWWQLQSFLLPLQCNLNCPIGCHPYTRSKLVHLAHTPCESYPSTVVVYILQYSLQKEYEMRGEYEICFWYSVLCVQLNIEVAGEMHTKH